MDVVCLRLRERLGWRWDSGFAGPPAASVEPPLTDGAHHLVRVD